MKGALLAIFFSAYIGSINAAVITRTIDVELLSDWIGPGTDQSGNAGNRLLFEPQSVDPFFVQAGDVIVTQVNFLSPHALKLTDLGNNFYSTLGGASSNLEPVSFGYRYSDNNASTGSISVANVSGQITWDVLSGIANPLSFSATSSGSGFPIFSKVTGSNITDSTVVITGFSIQSNINEFYA